MNQLVSNGVSASFRIGDAIYPDVIQTLRQAGPELAVNGKVLYLSDSGDRKDHFAIVDVAGIPTPLIVPVNRLHVEYGQTENPNAAMGVSPRTVRLDSDPVSDRQYVNFRWRGG